LCKELVHLQHFTANNGQLCIECPACLERSVYSADPSHDSADRLAPSAPSAGSFEQSASLLESATTSPKTPDASVVSSVVPSVVPSAVPSAVPSVVPSVVSSVRPSLSALETEHISASEPLSTTAKIRAPKEPPQAKDPAIQEPDIDAFCPKCWEKRREETSSCHKCGLVFANIGVTFDPRKDADATGYAGREARVLWSSLLASWEDEHLHKQFLQYCQVQGLLELAAQYYRKERAMRGASALIDAQLDRLLEMAQQQFLQANKANAEPSNSPVRIAVLLLMLLGCGTLLVMLLRFWQSGGGWAP
jgi:hypothetical protein